MFSGARSVLTKEYYAVMKKVSFSLNKDMWPVISDI